jgi:hypothetical protein
MTQTPSEPAAKTDANQLLQDWKKEKLSTEEQTKRVKSLLIMADPLVMIMASQAGSLRGAEKDDAVKQIAELIRAMPEEDREQHIRKIAKAAKEDLATFRALTKPKKAAKKEDDDGEAERITGGWINEHLIEIAFDSVKCQTFFAVRYPDGRVDPHVEKVTIEGKTYKPIWPNSILTKNGVRLPNEIYDKPLSEKELMTITKTHINTYFDFGSNDFFEELAPQFVPFTYFADAFMETSYLRALGDYGTGKTRFLKAIGLICYRPIYVTGGSSPASLYHFLDTYKGTLVLNEADFGQSDEASIIAKILNGGTERDEGISKMKKDAEGNLDIEMYNVFGPKVIATRKGFDDRAIESRCLTMEMVPMAPHPRIPRHLPPNYGQICLEIRNLWTTYRLFNARESITIDESQTDYALEARLSQISGPLMNIISDPEVKEHLKAFMRDYNEREKTDRYQTKTARVMEGLIKAFAWGPVSESPSDEGRVYLKDIALASNMVTDEMNKRMGDDEEEERVDPKGKRSGGKFTSRGISSIMDKYLQLRTWRATDGTPDYKGTMYIDLNRDGERIKALCERWGVKELIRGSEKRPIKINLNDPEAIAKKIDPDQPTFYTDK